jgi:hypothetical protein
MFEFLKKGQDGDGLTNFEDDLRGFGEVGGKLCLCPDQQPEYHRVFYAFNHCKKKLFYVSAANIKETVSPDGFGSCGHARSVLGVSRGSG